MNRLQQFLESGDWPALRDEARRVLATAPDDAMAWTGLGLSLCALNDRDAATVLPQAIQHCPDSPDLHNAHGMVLAAQGNHKAALDAYGRALALDCLFAQAHNNRANSLNRLGRHRDAEIDARQAITIWPNYPNAYNTLGNSLKAQNRLDEAAAAYGQALTLAPNFAAACSNLGSVLKQANRLLDALALFERTVSLDPSYADGWFNLGNSLKDFTRFDAADAAYQKAMDLNPAMVAAAHNRLFALNYHPTRSAEEIFAAYRDYEARFAAPLYPQQPQHIPPATPPQRLKIGYVSPDFRDHPTTHFLLPWLEQHDRKRFELFAYAELEQEDAITARYRAVVDHWCPTRSLTDAQLAQRIQDDGIHILVDLAGHTGGNRLDVFARKPAPIAVSWWIVHVASTGLSAIDYLLGDPIALPDGFESLCAETPWRLDGPSYVFRPDPAWGAVSPLPALDNGFITFCSLSRLLRLNERVIARWSRLLHACPQSRLVIGNKEFHDPAVQALIRQQFAAHAIAPERLELGYFSPVGDLLRRCDVMLDPFPQTSGTTLLQGLYMGLPSITLASRPSAGRQGAAHLTWAGHPEWVAVNEEEYEAKILALTADLPRLAAIRADLRDDFTRSPLADAAGLTRRIEAAYEQMWQRFITA